MKIGIGKTEITPPLGIEMVGYYYKRNADGIHDRLYARAIVFDDGKNKAAIVSCDICGFDKSTILLLKDKLSKSNILPFENIIICATHTHTGPVITSEYESYLVGKILESVKEAYENLFEATLSYGSAHVEGVAFNRRYFMKDGTVVTNPGKCNPDIVKPAGPAPTEVPFIRIDKNKSNESYIFVNVSLHPDTIAGNLISADYPYYIEKEIKGNIPDVKEIICTNGTSGNINHWDVKNPDPQRGFHEAERIGRTIGSEIVSKFDKTLSISQPLIKIGREKARLPYVKVSKEEVAKAKEVLKKPYPDGVDFTMEVVEAKKVVKASKITNDFNEIEIAAISIGDLAFIGMPAELFVELGMEIKNLSPFKNTVTIGLAYGSVGYIPTEKAYEEGGYEAVANMYKSGVGRIILEVTLKLLKSINSS